MKKFKEKKVVNVLNFISMICLLIFVLSVLLMMVNIKFGYGLFSCVFALIFLSISESCSELEKYTDEFILYINNKIDNAKTIEEYLEIEKEFYELAIENNHYCLKYPTTIKNIHIKINNQIEVLEKIKK